MRDGDGGHHRDQSRTDRRPAAVLAFAASALCAAGSSAQAMPLYCLESHSLNWHDAEPVLRDGGLHEFWLDTVEGHWRGRVVGGRAGTVDGGTLDIRNDGAGYRMNWVGLVVETAEALTIDLEGEAMTFVWTRRDQSAEIGVCVDATDREFLDGVEVAR